MMFPVWIEVVCANCARQGAGMWHYKGIFRRAMLQEDAEKQGFMFKHKEVFCSERCRVQWREPAKVVSK